MGKLKDKRTEIGMTQKELAEKSKVNVRMVEYYEQGYKDIRKASVDTVQALAKALGCSIEDII